MPNVSTLNEHSRMQSLRDDVKVLRGKARELGNDLRAKLNNTAFNRAWKNSLRKKKELTVDYLSEAQQ